MDQANLWESQRVAAVNGQQSSDVWRGQGAKIPWESAVQLNDEPFFTKESHYGATGTDADPAHPSSTADNHKRALAEEKAKADRIAHNAALPTDYHWNGYNVMNPGSGFWEIIISIWDRYFLQ